MGPGPYSDISKKARDLLYRDYHSDTKVTIAIHTTGGLAITSNATKKGESLFFTELTAQLKNKSITYDVKLDSRSNILTTFTVDEPVPGFKTIFSYFLPSQKSGIVELQYLHEYAALSTSIGLTVNPTVKFSGVVGNNAISIGTEVAFDTFSGSFTRCNAGLRVTHVDLVAAMSLDNKGDTLFASYCHQIDPLTIVGAEIAHQFSNNHNTLTFGAQHELNPSTSVKARVNNYGTASALVQHKWHPRSLLTISGEVNIRSIGKGAKVGLALCLKP